MNLHHIRRGRGKPLLLVHGLGSSRRAWGLITLALAEHREVIAIDLPGHGDSPAQADSGTFAGVTRSVDAWLTAQDLVGVDMVGSSLGGRLVLELARTGRAGAVVALDPGGFWEGWERRYAFSTLKASIALLRAAAPTLPALARTTAGRTFLLAQLSAHPWALNGGAVAAELASLIATPTFDALLSDVAFGSTQEGPAAPQSGPVTIGWGRHDRLTFPTQATRAIAAFPGAGLHWFQHSGHFPMLDEPDEAVALILDKTG